MKVLSSHLAMRFYHNCGWTESLLESCLMPESKLLFCDGLAYWVLGTYSHFDLEKLKPHITEILDYKGAVVPENEWDAFLREFNA